MRAPPSGWFAATLAEASSPLLTKSIEASLTDDDWEAATAWLDNLTDDEVEAVVAALS